MVLTQGSQTVTMLNIMTSPSVVGLRIFNEAQEKDAGPARLVRSTMANNYYQLQTQKTPKFGQE